MKKAKRILAIGENISGNNNKYKPNILEIYNAAGQPRRITYASIDLSTTGISSIPVLKFLGASEDYY